MASKGKGKEKDKSTPAPAPVESPPDKYIVPGKLTEKGWLELLSRADGTEIATDIVTEVCEVAFSIIYSHYLEKQAFPHTINDARHSLLKIIEWQFLSRDEGEGNTTSDPSWVEDEEPVPATIDSWARGMVPSATLSTLSSLIDTLDPVQVTTSLPPRPRPPPVVEEDSSEGSIENSRPCSELRGSTSGSKRKSAPVKMKTRARPVAHHSKARFAPIPPPPEDTHSPTAREDIEPTPSLRSHTPMSLTGEIPTMPRPLPYGMKPVQLNWQKEVTYDQSGNLVHMVRLDPTKFPSHCVKPTVTLVKPPPSQPSKTATHSTRRLKPIKNKALSVPPQAHGDPRHRSIRGVKFSMGESRRFPERPTLPSLVDTIDPVSGVTVREAGRTVHGPQAHKTLTGYARESTLAPIQSPRMNHNYSDTSSNRSTYVDVQ